MDLKYLVSSLGMLTGVPVRIYREGECEFMFSVMQFPVDPVAPYIGELFTHKEHIGYISTDDFFYFEFINYNEYMIVVGPSRTVRPNKQVLTDYAFRLDIKPVDMDNFIEAMQSIVSMPLETLVQSLCMFNYVLNNEKLNHTDVILNENTISDAEAEVLAEHANDPHSDYNYFEHNTMDLENAMCSMVSHGEYEKLKEWIRTVPAIRSGILSADSLRNVKNTFVVTATLLSRAAIRGGLDIEEALSLSDQYIQKMELMDSPVNISNLNLKMLLDYTERVSKIQNNANSSELLIGINKYVYAHISEPIKMTDLCNALFISKTALYDRLEKETGRTVSDYILNIKINESRGLLKHSDKTITQIGNYLGFSSSSHFNHTFRKFVGVTPKEYRERHANNQLTKR